MWTVGYTLLTALSTTVKIVYIGPVEEPGSASSLNFMFEPLEYTATAIKPLLDVDTLNGEPR